MSEGGHPATISITKAGIDALPYEECTELHKKDAEEINRILSASIPSGTYRYLCKLLWNCGEDYRMKVEQIDGINHASGAFGFDATLCGLVTSGDSSLEISESKTIEGEITCKDCLRIIRYCKGLKI